MVERTNAPRHASGMEHVGVRGAPSAWRIMRKRSIGIAMLSLAATSAALADPCGDGPPVPAMEIEPAVFDKPSPALRQELKIRANGVSVPHHLAAAHLIAAAFDAIRTDAIDKIVILSPDHFRRAQRPFATTTRSFATRFGTVCPDVPGVQSLLAQADLVENSALFEREHGVGAVLPFLRRALPSVGIVPVALALSSRRPHWDALVALLRPIITERTLVVQSTDFSHYLTAGEAILRDQVTLNLLAGGEARALGRLSQPQHLDSPGAQYVMARLQDVRGGPRPVVLFNENSQSYSDQHETETTSYVVQVFPHDPVPYVLPAAPGSRRLCLAGDVFTGRFLHTAAFRGARGNAMADRLREVLRGCPLVVNLEGAFGPVRQARASDRRLAMSPLHALRWLRRLGVVAAGLANNHAHDLGRRALGRTERTLRQAGIRPLREREVADLGGLRLVALSDLDNTRRPGADRLRPSDLARLARDPARPPLVAFLHWGTEGVAQPSERERVIAAALMRAGVGLVAGAHPHVASDRLETLGGGDGLLAYSLGNLLFDQPAPASGAVLELTIFAQGTVYARLVPVPNVYGEALAGAVRADH